MLSEKVKETVAFIQEKTHYRPQIAIVLGSGLGQLANDIEDAIYIAYEQLPHFVSSTAPGHDGKLIFGKLAGKEVLCMQGRFHYYEGYSMQEITYPVRVMAQLGIQTLLLSNAAGGINRQFQVGEFMLITDHINFLGDNPLIGPNEQSFGPRFHDMSYGYDMALREYALQAAEKIGCKLHQGVYVATTGPSYETPAEIKMFGIWGAQAVGMSTVPEVLVANHCGMKVMAISCITNMAAGILDQRLDAEEVIEIGLRSSDVFLQLMTNIVASLPVQP